MRLIDADVLKRQIESPYTEYPIMIQIRKALKDFIDDAPSIDIVRCVECKWGKPYSDKQLECDVLGLGGLKFPDDFCSYGERRESDA